MTKFESHLQTKIDSLNSILKELGAPEIASNSDFEIDVLSWEYWLKFRLVSSDKNWVTLAITIAASVVQIDVDGTNEAFLFPQRASDDLSDSAKELIREILSSYILIERSNHQKKMHLFARNGTFQRSFNLSTSIIGTVSKFFVENRDKRLFFPIYPRNDRGD